MKAVELFAGIGGFSEGARPTKVKVVWAANHWPAACDTFRANHAEPIPQCQDLQQANFAEVPSHDILHASSACQGHAYARGKERPHHDNARATAWAVVTCAEVHRSPIVLLENVPEFLKWALFPAWESAMESLGYALSLNILDSADHGVPQHRRRLFILATRSRAPFELRKVRREHVPFSAIEDASADLWSPVRTKCPNTRARVKAGRRAFGDRFVMPYYGSGSGKTGRSVARPIGTITTLDRWALVDGNRMRMLTVLESKRAMGFRDEYVLPSNKKLAKHLLGNAVPPQFVTDILTDLEARF